MTTSVIQPLGNFRRAFRRLLLGAMCFAWAMVTQAAPDSVALILSDDSAPYQEFANRFRATLDGRGIRVSVLGASSLAANGGAALAGVDLLVPVGVRATEATLQANNAAPVLATLLPRTAYAQLKKKSGARERAFSAIYLDQPLSRRFALIDVALPERKKVGVLLGPDSAGELRALHTAARDHGHTLAVERITDADELLPALKHVLMDSDVLLALPDSTVFSRQTAQSILLTSYRAQNPLIAYSQSYVSAGALAAVHSTPVQIAQQAAELVLKASKSAGAPLPAPQYPKYFSVSVNSQVARSMGIAIEDENTLRDRLIAGEVRE